MRGEVLPKHPGSFWFPSTRLLLATYVDDFLLSGPEAHRDSFWKELEKRVDTEDIGDLSRFLGRHHDTVIFDDDAEGLAFNMRDYMKAACERYAAIPGVKPFRKVPTPSAPKDPSLPPTTKCRGSWLRSMQRPYEGALGGQARTS